MSGDAPDDKFMVSTGSMPREQDPSGKSSGIPAGLDFAGDPHSPTGGAAIRHWESSTISEPGLGSRGNIFFAAIQMTRMPMILTDPNQPDNPIAFANKAFLDLTGYEEDEVVGRNCRFLQGAQTSRHSVAEMRDAIAEQKGISIEVLNYKRDGTPFWNAVFIAPVYDEAGGLLYYFASQLDITRRRNSENSHRQAQKMEAIGQLTAGLAHDFNNLLQVVMGNLELLALRKPDERNAKTIENARRAAERGARLTNQLLAFARRSRLEGRPTDLSLLIGEFQEMIGATLGGDSSVTVRLELEPGLPACLVDPVQLEVALLNVLLNARDAMPDGGEVVVSTGRLQLADSEAMERRLSPGEYVTLSVADQGGGMPPHVLERAVEPFFTTKGAGKGTGLGLAMVHGFSQQSHGRLEIESEPGRGSIVRLILPTSDAAAPVAVAAVESDRRETMADNAQTILVVEDSEDVLTLAVEYLTGLGYGVVTASDAEEAMRVFERDPDGVDLLFSDVIMPGGMNGLALAEEIAKRRPDLPILLTTGYNDEMFAEGPRRTSMDVLGKPYRRSELSDRVNAALNSSRGARRTPSNFVAAEG
jgi:PAS domain S-box-containing protein